MILGQTIGRLCITVVLLGFIVGIIEGLSNI